MVKLLIKYKDQFHNYEISEERTVLFLKSAIRIHLHINISEDDQCLVYDGRTLNNANTLEDYGMENGSRIVIYEIRTFKLLYGDQRYDYQESEGINVFSLKALLQPKIGVEAEDQAMVCGGEQLENQRIIQYYHLGDDLIRVYRRFVISVYGRCGEYRLNVHEGMTINELKQQVEDLYGIDKAELNFKICLTGFLQDGKTLKDYGIYKDTSTVIYLYGD